MTALLLEVFNLFPQILRDLSGRRRSVIRLWESILLQEFLLVSLNLLLVLELLIDHLLQLSLKFYLHYSHVRRHNMPQFLLYGQFGSQGVQEWLHLHKVLHVGDGQLLDRHLSLKVNCLIFVNRFVTQLNHVCVLGIIVFLII
jgi:hypothetical protein